MASKPGPTPSNTHHPVWECFGVGGLEGLAGSLANAFKTDDSSDNLKLSLLSKASKAASTSFSFGAFSLGCQQTRSSPPHRREWIGVSGDQRDEGGFRE
jgi:hypothetical protein